MTIRTSEKNTCLGSKIIDIYVTSNGTGNACVGNLSYLKIFKLFSLGEEDLAVS